MFTPLIDRLYVDAVAAVVAPTPAVGATMLLNAFASVTEVDALAVKPEMFAALTAAALAKAEPTVWPGSAPATLAPMVTGAAVPTARVRLPDNAAVPTVAGDVAICPICVAPTPCVRLIEMVLPTFAPTW